MSLTLRNRTAMMRIVCGLVALGLALDAAAQPEKIRPGHSYYSDELAEPTHQGLVRALGPEKNYEEVYQRYRYYELVYDQAERVVLFRQYERGERIRTEEYRYDDTGSLIQRVIAQPGKEDQITTLDPSPGARREDPEEH